MQEPLKLLNLPPNLLISSRILQLCSKPIGQGGFILVLYSDSILYNHVITVNFLGEFGTVFKAKLDVNSRRGLPHTVAVKVMKGMGQWIFITTIIIKIDTLVGLYTTSDVERMISEISKMKDFQHPNVMSLIGVCLDAGPGVSIIMPFMANGSLLDYLKRERNNLYVKDDAELDAV